MRPGRWPRSLDVVRARGGPASRLSGERRTADMRCSAPARSPGRGPPTRPEAKGSGCRTAPSCALGHRGTLTYRRVANAGRRGTAAASSPPILERNISRPLHTSQEQLFRFTDALPGPVTKRDGFSAQPVSPEPPSDGMLEAKRNHACGQTSVYCSPTSIRVGSPLDHLPPASGGGSGALSAQPLAETMPAGPARGLRR